MLALVVDDSRMARYVLSKMLKEQGINVDTVESGEEALGYLCGKAPDMIFMDHTMPGMDGFQALRAIKNDPRTSPIPIMMYTSKEGEVYMNQARQLGAVDVLPKQLKPDQLIAVLEKQKLLPHLADLQEAANEDGEPTARIVTASDLGEDIREVAQAAEKSIANKNFANQVRRLLDEHKEELAEQAKGRTENLLDQFDLRLQALTDRINDFSENEDVKKIRIIPTVITGLGGNYYTYSKKISQKACDEEIEKQYQEDLKKID
ncbi:MAG: response regulator, partial [Pseudomonadales bacterium]|nr:response regulator [Pseudomonadales bacterium]